MSEHTTPHAQAFSGINLDTSDEFLRWLGNRFRFSQRALGLEFPASPHCLPHYDPSGKVNTGWPSAAPTVCKRRSSLNKLRVVFDEWSVSLM